jgi:putative membrane protein
MRGGHHPADGAYASIGSTVALVASTLGSPMRDESATPPAGDTRLMWRTAMWTVLVVAVAVGVAAAVVPGIDVDGGVLTLLWVALLFGVVNALLGPIVHLLALPLTVITFGLFGLVVNGLLLATTAGLSDDLDVGGFLGTVVGALIISIITAVLGLVLRPMRAASG